jgi:glycosyltransferase involved in cell wall biosynthesis
MKILVCHNRYRQRTGEDVAFENMLRLLERNGHHPTVYEVSNERLRGSLATAASLVAALFSPSTYFRLRALARREKPQVAIVQNVYPLLSPSVYWALRHEGVPIAQNVFNYRLACPSGNFFSRGRVCERCIRGNYFHGAVRLCYRGSFVLSGLYAAVLGLHRFLGTFVTCIDRFLVPDQFFRTKLEEAGFDGRRFRHASNPFDPRDFASSSEDDGTILFVGRLVAEKGIRTLLEAAKQVPEARIRIVGDGPLAPEVKARSGGRVEFLGARYGAELGELMSRCRTLVVPSLWYDNGPMVVYQAFATAKPVIASNIDGLPELVIPGETGWLVSPGDAAALAAAIREALGNPEVARRLGRGARAWAESHFGAERYYQDLRSALEEIARKEPGETPIRAGPSGEL